MQAQIVSACQCYSSVMPEISNASQCLSLAQIKCSLAIIDTYSDTTTQACYSDCPDECNTELFTLSFSFSGYPPDTYAKYLIANAKLDALYPNSTVTYEIVQQTMAFISVFYDTLGYTLISQEPKFSTFDLVSAIGGTLAFFLGMYIYISISIYFLTWI